jgi:hypothetical protein
MNDGARLVTGRSCHKDKLASGRNKVNALSTRLLCKTTCLGVMRRLPLFAHQAKKRGNSIVKMKHFCFQLSTIEKRQFHLQTYVGRWKNIQWTKKFNNCTITGQKWTDRIDAAPGCKMR